ncbi:PLAC8 family-domain-containing protein [Penicillium canescens]|uniref:PLAC8 family-domain-containing protein n=1 Tax=Penicillium canescens TaxID=5083 RepID=A0AAD6IHN8_PENCN|nr:PLAC8 family-domain-containing protein [Penicillium canescens]KAJ6047561.1 PLAC8 family-domain-containing protein [Penicillium canescens]KAJ6048842.1 PLAC8 family-domain-containing protein [Penicillium canescens]KAJ6100645.1 PLAC8 family-domain-containing protein [Penicillium canescens]KAJ6173105.1 PLAC8 family-domain-containing protein [Penicillium canescens]
MSCCLPCLTFGKTQARVKNPTLSNFSYCNSDCGLFTCLGFVWSHWILQTIRRSELRQQFGIKGNCCGDCCAVFWCSCCAIIQEEKEAELRTRPAAQAAYQPTSGMVYPQ